MNAPLLMPSLTQQPYATHCADAIDFLRSLDDACLDVVITDPPYESLEKHRRVGTTTRLKVSRASSNEWFDIFPNERLASLMSELYRVLKKNSHCYIMCDQETAFILKPIGESVGFKFWKPIIWDKVKIGMGYHYRARYEMILFFEKGKRRLNHLGIPDVLSFPRVHGGYPTEKPVNLMQVLLEQSTNELETVCDPFMGSGSSGVAALQSKRYFLGNDISPKALTFATNRLSSVRESLETAWWIANGNEKLY